MFSIIWPDILHKGFIEALVTWHSMADLSGDTVQANADTSGFLPSSAASSEPGLRPYPAAGTRSIFKALSLSAHGLWAWHELHQQSHATVPFVTGKMRAKPWTLTPGELDVQVHVSCSQIILVSDLHEAFRHAENSLHLTKAHDYCLQTSSKLAHIWKQTLKDVSLSEPMILELVEQMLSHEWCRGQCSLNASAGWS